MGFFDGSLFDLTGDDAFYLGTDEIEELEEVCLDYDELEMMDEDERRETLVDAGLDPDEYGEMTMSSTMTVVQ